MSEVYGMCSANMELKSFYHKSGEDREGRQAALFMFSLCGLSGTLCIRISFHMVGEVQILTITKGRGSLVDTSRCG